MLTYTPAPGGFGLDSLRYFWTARTPDGLARDLDRVLRSFAAQWNKRRALLIGYSQGADVLPFAVPRLSAASSALVSHTVLIGPHGPEITTVID